MTAITRNLPWIIRDPGVAIIGQKCYESLIEDLDFSDSECIKYSISKALGVAIVLGGSIMKVPQLLLILRAKNAKGLSLPAFGMETLAYLITFIYAYRNQFPFSTYGENLFLTIQNVLITLSIIYYFPHPQSHLTTKRAPSNTPVVFLASAITLVATYVLLVVPVSTLQLLQMGTVPISLISKLPQISQNYSNKSTGQLSVFAVVSQIFGCAARLFTTLTEVDDVIILAGFALAFVLNLILGIQIWQYWGSDVRGAAKMKEKESYPAEKAPPTSTPTHQHPAFAPITPASAPLPPSNRRWARKID